MSVIIIIIKNNIKNIVIKIITININKLQVIYLESKTKKQRCQGIISRRTLKDGIPLRKQILIYF